MNDLPRKLYISFVIVILVSSAVTTNSQDQKLYITIYYESLCPDSKDFILRQLQPAVKYLHKYISLRLIPFGKSKSINRGIEGFVCQHGPKECLGNLVQDCALSHMNDQSDAEKVSYVACEMARNAGANGSYTCVRLANLPVHDVEGCVNSEEGNRLQRNSEFLTKLARPSFVPTIVIDGMFLQEVQDAALVDFVGTLCSMLYEIKFCAHYYNKIAMDHLLRSPLTLYQYH